MNILFYYRGRTSPAIESLSSVLKKDGHSVDLIFDPGLDSTFYYHSHILKMFNTDEFLLEKAQRFSPDILAFSSTTNLWPFVSKMAERLKNKLKVPVIVGGVHPTALPDYVIKRVN